MNEDLFKEEPEVAPITQEVDHGHDLQTQPDLLDQVLQKRQAIF